MGYQLPEGKGRAHFALLEEKPLRRWLFSCAATCDWRPSLPESEWQRGVPEADQLSSKKIRTEHLLLGLLRDENGLAAELLQERGIRLVSTREELNRSPHDDSATEEFVRERSPLPEDVVESQTRIRSIVSRMEAVIANHDFAKARLCSHRTRQIAFAVSTTWALRLDLNRSLRRGRKTQVEQRCHSEAEPCLSVCEAPTISLPTFPATSV
jgi:ATP-dependent Clp protease ATP-binding subunit ClpA